MVRGDIIPIPYRNPWDKRGGSHRGKQVPYWPNPGTGACSLGDIRLRHLHLLNCSASRGGVESRRISNVLIFRHACREVRVPLANKPPFCIQVAGYGDLTPIREEAASMKGLTEGLFILNQVILRRLLSCLGVFGEREHFSASFLLLAFIKYISLMKSSPYPAYDGGRFSPCIPRQGMVEASTHIGLDANLLAQNIDGNLSSANSLRADAWVHLDAVLSICEALCYLDTVAFVMLHLFSAVR